VLDNFARLEHDHDAQEIRDIEERVLKVTEPRYAKYNHHHTLSQVDDIAKLDERYSEKKHTHTASEITDFAKGVENVIGDKFTASSHGHGYQDITGFDERVAELTDGKFAPTTHTHKCDDIVDLWKTINGKVERLYAKISHAHSVDDITDLRDTISGITTDLNGCIDDIRDLKEKQNSVSRVPFQNFRVFAVRQTSWTVPDDCMCTISISVKRGGGKYEYALMMKPPNGSEQ